MAQTERRRAAIMLTDIVGDTSIAQRIEIHELQPNNYAHIGYREPLKGWKHVELPPF